METKEEVIAHLNHLRKIEATRPQFSEKDIEAIRRPVDWTNEDIKAFRFLRESENFTPQEKADYFEKIKENRQILAKKGLWRW